MSLVGRVIDDHQLFGGDDLPCKVKDHVVVLNSNPPGRKGECLCSLRGQTGYVPNSKLILIGYVQCHGGDIGSALEESPIYEVPPGAMPRDGAPPQRPGPADQSARLAPASAAAAQPPPSLSARVSASAGSSASTAAADQSRDAPPEYVVFVDEKLATSRPPGDGCGAEERQLVVREGPGGHPSPILRHKSSLRSSQQPRRHSSAASVPDGPNAGPARQVLRWADSPSIIEIPRSPAKERHQSEGDYDDLTVATGAGGGARAGAGAGGEGGHVAPDYSDCVQPSKHSTAIRALLRSFSADLLRSADVEGVKVLLERIHWYTEDCSNRLLRFIRPRWKTVESLAVTIPALYDVCTLYHSMSQVFTTFVYVCLERAADCVDRQLAKKLLKHLHPLEKQRQVYGNAVACLDSLQWQPAEIERLAAAPATDYLGDIVASLREINIEERSLYTALTANLELLFTPGRPAAAGGVNDVARELDRDLQRLSFESESSSQERDSDQRRPAASGADPPTMLNSHQRMPYPKPPIVPIPGSSSPSRLVTFADPYSERRSGYSPTSLLRSAHSFARNGQSLPLRPDPAAVSTVDGVVERHSATANSARPPVPVGGVHSPGRRHSNLSYEESSHSDDQYRPSDANVSNSSSTPPVLYSPPSSLSPRGSRDSITTFGSQSNGRANQELRIQVAKVESHVEVVITAIGNFLQCLDNDQPPNVFVQHSKFVVVSAQKLLTVSDLIGHGASDTDAGQRVLALTNRLCEQLKAVVYVTKAAAMRYPSPEALRHMLDEIQAVSDISVKLRAEVTQMAQF